MQIFDARGGREPRLAVVHDAAKPVAALVVGFHVHDSRRQKRPLKHAELGTRYGSASLLLNIAGPGCFDGLGVFHGDFGLDFGSARILGQRSPALDVASVTATCRLVLMRIVRFLAAHNVLFVLEFTFRFAVKRHDEKNIFFF